MYEQMAIGIGAIAGAFIYKAMATGQGLTTDDLMYRDAGKLRHEGIIGYAVPGIKGTQKKINK